MRAAADLVPLISTCPRPIPSPTFSVNWIHNPGDTNLHTHGIHARIGEPHAPPWKRAQDQDPCTGPGWAAARQCKGLLCSAASTVDSGWSAARATAELCPPCCTCMCPHRPDPTQDPLPHHLAPSIRTGVPSQATATTYLYGDNVFNTIPARNSTRYPAHSRLFNLKIAENHLSGMHWVRCRCAVARCCCSARLSRWKAVRC